MTRTRPIDLQVQRAGEQALRNEQRQNDGLGPAVGSYSQRFRVKSEQADYLTCRTYDGTTEGAVDIYVAKPPDLRGNAATRTSGSQDEIIRPVYVVDGDIWASVPMGGTGVTTPSGQAIWLDDNQDSRRWQFDCTA